MVPRCNPRPTRKGPMTTRGHTRLSLHRIANVRTAPAKACAEMAQAALAVVLGWRTRLCVRGASQRRRSGDGHSSGRDGNLMTTERQRPNFPRDWKANLTCRTPTASDMSQMTAPRSPARRGGTGRGRGSSADGARSAENVSALLYTLTKSDRLCYVLPSLEKVSPSLEKVTMIL